jgi:PPOX class probable F420-dependent enzyme
METSTALTFAREHRRSVLVTIKHDTHPQLSNVMHGVGDDEVIRISITADRAKYKNLVKRPWAALHITQDDFWAYVVIEGDATLSAVATAPEDDTVEELIAMYRSAAGEHPDWDDYRRAMVADQRVVARIHPTHVYGMLPPG